MNNRKIRLAVTSLAATAAFTPAVFGFAELARGTLVATANFETAYDTNIFANSSEVDDLTGIFTPGLSYTRNVARIATSVDLGMKAISFADTSGQSAIDPFLSASFTLDRAEKGSAALSLAYARTTEANNILLTRTESDEYRAGGKIDYYYSEKTGLRFNANYRRSGFNTTGYNNVSSYSLGTGLLYRYSPKLVASATYDYSPEKATNLGGGPSNPSSQNHRFKLGVEGALTPKLNGTLAVGYAYREFETGGSNDAILLESSLRWDAAEKTSFTFSASNNFDTTAGAESAKIFDASLMARQVLTDKISANAKIGYQHTQLDRHPGPVARTDEAIITGLGVDYTINDNWNASAEVTHRINDSTLALADYDRTVISLSLALNF
jgi:polysaccharide biosynthesis protein VpsM